jgi:RimJ/RimL family protein N-acetyltransferase
VAAWVLKHEAQGRGIALEAALSAHEWLADVRRIRRTVCMIHPGNASSLRLADHLGYRAIGESKYKGEVVTLFERRKII